MKIFSVLSLLSISLTGCDPGVETARVKPDRSIELPPENGSTIKRSADVYATPDKKVELQIYKSSGMGQPDVSGLLVNNRTYPLEIDLADVSFTLFTGEQAKPCGTWFEGCGGSSQAYCGATKFTLQPSTSKNIRLGCAGRGELHLVVHDDGKAREEIVVKFKLCKVGGIGGTCATTH